MNVTTDHDCCADNTGDLLSVEQGRTRILNAVQGICSTEQLSLRLALHRVLARPVVSAIDVPPFDNSAMDGYAIRSTDCRPEKSCSLSIIGESFAGSPFTGRVNQGECIRIMTGAVMPEGADAVVMQEDVTRRDDFIELGPGNGIRAGQNVRYAGEDTHCGDTVLAPGIRIGAAEIGLLASVGVSEVTVCRRIRVAYFSTGDELAGIGSSLQAGQIYDSNRYTLFGLLHNEGIEACDLGVIPDDRQAVRAAFKQASETSDLVITSGGVSVGEADFVTETLAELGQVSLWRMATKPGKPLAFGRLGQAYFFGLPGNPVSVMATFYQFVLPALNKMAGLNERPPLLIQVSASETFRKAPGRTEFQRGVLFRDERDEWAVRSTGTQGSHVLSSMSKANCFVILDADSDGAQQGSLVTVQPFSDFC